MKRRGLKVVFETTLLKYLGRVPHHSVVVREVEYFKQATQNAMGIIHIHQKTFCVDYTFSSICLISISLWVM